MRATLLVLSTLLCTLALGAQPASSPRDEVVAARQAWWEAFLRRDVDTMMKIEADDFVFVNNGVVTDRSRLERMRGLKPIARKDTLDVKRFELHGPIAIMSGYIKVSPAAADPALVAFSDVWERQSTAWRLKSSHLSRPVVVRSPERTLPGLRPASELPSDLRAALARRDQVIKAGSGAGYGQIVTDDLINVDANGDVQSRSDRMRLIGTIDNVVGQESAGFRNCGGDTVIYTYGTGTARIFVSEVWVKRPAGWQMAHRQSTLK